MVINKGTISLTLSEVEDFVIKKHNDSFRELRGYNSSDFINEFIESGFVNASKIVIQEALGYSEVILVR